MPIAQSTQGNELYYADPVWLSKLGRGMRYLIGALTLTLLMFWFGRFVWWMTSGPVWVNLLMLAVDAIPHVAALIGCCYVTTLDPQLLSPSEWTSPRILARCAAAENVVAGVVTGV